MRPSGSSGLSGLATSTDIMVNKRSGLALSVADRSAGVGEGLIQAHDSGDDSQRIRWWLAEGSLGREQLATAAVTLSPLHDLLNLEVPSGSSSGAPVTQGASTGGDNQKWRISHPDGAFFRFVNKATGKALSVDSSSTNENAKLIAADVADDTSQIWSLPSLWANIRARWK